MIVMCVLLQMLEVLQVHSSAVPVFSLLYTVISQSVVTCAQFEDPGLLSSELLEMWGGGRGEGGVIPVIIWTVSSPPTPMVLYLSSISVFTSSHDMLGLAVGALRSSLPMNQTFMVPMLWQCDIIH